MRLNDLIALSSSANALIDALAKLSMAVVENAMASFSVTEFNLTVIKKHCLH